MEPDLIVSSSKATTHPIVLHVDDDPNDTELMRAAARRMGAAIVLKGAADVTEAMFYL